MQSIGKLCLKNYGGFVVKIQVRYTDDYGNSSVTKEASSSFPLGQRVEIDPSASPFNVPDGSPVSLVANIAGGTNVVAQQTFTLQVGNPNVANYMIAGTTLQNDLGLINVRPD
jgi:hypothetical protein